MSIVRFSNMVDFNPFFPLALFVRCSSDVDVDAGALTRTKKSKRHNTLTSVRPNYKYRGITTLHYITFCGATNTASVAVMQLYSYRERGSFFLFRQNRSSVLFFSAGLSFLALHFWYQNTGRPPPVLPLSALCWFHVY